ncbi:unnamed protein product, partial [marine sediment metagenome]
GNTVDLNVIDKLAEIMNSAPRGDCKILFHYRTDNEEGKFVVGHDRHVALSGSLLDSLRDLVGKSCVAVTYRKQPAAVADDSVESAA